MVTLADCFTSLESQLGASGHGELVTQGRRAIHDGMRLEATAIVEELTERHVAAYLTAQQDDADLALLVFYLAPSQPSAGDDPRYDGPTDPGRRRHGRIIEAMFSALRTQDQGDDCLVSAAGELDMATSPIARARAPQGRGQRLATARRRPPSGHLYGPDRTARAARGQRPLVDETGSESLRRRTQRLFEVTGTEEALPSSTAIAPTGSRIEAESVDELAPGGSARPPPRPPLRIGRRGRRR